MQFYLDEMREELVGFTHSRKYIYGGLNNIILCADNI